MHVWSALQSTPLVLIADWQSTSIAVVLALVPVAIAVGGGIAQSRVEERGMD